MSSETEIQRIKLLSLCIIKAFKVAVDKELPPPADVEMMATDMSEKLFFVPDLWLVKLYEMARIYADFPTVKLLAKTWNKSLKDEWRKKNPVLQIAPKQPRQRTEAADNDFWRGVVVVRIGTPYPMATDEQKRLGIKTKTIMVDFEGRQSPKVAADFDRREAEAWLEMFTEMPSIEGLSKDYWARNNFYGYTTGDLDAALGFSEPQELVF
ncbi:MAG: hypothetical protein JRC86_04755 [Deltaproteobacteria bacterium]|nr:hypothetical protein [Deltaproteobacteria bacterium]